MKTITNKNASKRAGTPIRGGKGSMQKQQHTGQQKPGVTSQESGASPSGIAAKGGKGKMFGKQTSKALKPA